MRLWARPVLVVVAFSIFSHGVAGNTGRWREWDRGWWPAWCGASASRWGEDGAMPSTRRATWSAAGSLAAADFPGKGGSNWKLCADSNRGSGCWAARWQECLVAVCASVMRRNDSQSQKRECGGPGQGAFIIYLLRPRKFQNYSRYEATRRARRWPRFRAQ